MNWSQTIWFSFVFERFWVNFIFENFITFTSRLPYSRHLEEEADEIGLLLAAKVKRIRIEDCFTLNMPFRLVMMFVNQYISGRQSNWVKQKKKSQNLFLRIHRMQNVQKISVKSFPGHLIYVDNVTALHYLSKNHWVNSIFPKIPMRKYVYIRMRERKISCVVFSCRSWSHLVNVLVVFLIFPSWKLCKKNNECLIFTCVSIMFVFSWLVYSDIGHLSNKLQGDVLQQTALYCYWKCFRINITD